MLAEWLLIGVMYRDGLRDTTTDSILAEGIVVDNVAFASPEPGGDRIAYAKLEKTGRTYGSLMGMGNPTG